jgi:CBS-domain-containing membrane protein
LTADDLMTRDIVRLPEKIPLREAANVLLRNQVGGAPVVDSGGRCVGVLSAVRKTHTRRTDWKSVGFRNGRIGNPSYEETKACRSPNERTCVL